MHWPSGMNTEGMHPLNELLSLVYPDLAPHPCAECCKRPGDSLRVDSRGAEALVCRPCSRMPREALDFALSPRELAIVERRVAAAAR